MAPRVITPEEQAILDSLKAQPGVGKAVLVGRMMTYSDAVTDPALLASINRLKTEFGYSVLPTTPAKFKRHLRLGNIELI